MKILYFISAKRLCVTSLRTICERLTLCVQLVNQNRFKVHQNSEWTRKRRYNKKGRGINEQTRRTFGIPNGTAGNQEVRMAATG